MRPTGGARFTPDINLFRDPRWGRAQESVSEDPYMNGLYASSFVKGLQGDVRYGDSTAGKPLLAAATCKHLAVYNLEVVNYDNECVLLLLLLLCCTPPRSAT